MGYDAGIKTQSIIDMTCTVCLCVYQIWLYYLTAGGDPEVYELILRTRAGQKKDKEGGDKEKKKEKKKKKEKNKDDGGGGGMGLQLLFGVKG